MFGFSSWKDRVVRSSVGGGWGRGGAGDDQVRGKLNRRLGGDASEPMCVPLEGSWPSCARPGRVPRTEQRALLCESLVPHPLPGPARLISPLPGARRPPPGSTWRCSREAGILQASAREGSLLMAGLRCSRTSTWAERSAGPRTCCPSVWTSLQPCSAPFTRQTPGLSQAARRASQPPRLPGCPFPPLTHRVQIRSFALLEF